MSTERLLWAFAAAIAVVGGFVGVGFIGRGEVLRGAFDLILAGVLLAVALVQIWRASDEH